MNTPTPYLHFPGNCEEAFNFYKKVFNGEFGFVGRFKEMPPDVPVPPGFAEKLMHISLMVDGQPFLMGSDAPEGYGEGFKAGNNVQLSLDPVSEAEAKQLYDALRDGGQVTMELGPTFWAKLFAMVRDRYGIYWMLSYGQPADQ
jgi:PhnB protein